MDHNTFCIAPWIYADFEKRDSKRIIRPCCSYGVDGKLPYEIDNLDDWEVSEKLGEIKANLLTGVRDPGCALCWRDEDLKNPSRRGKYNDLWGHTPPQTHKLTHFRLRTGNHCNLKCLMCQPRDSDKIAREYDHMGLEYSLTGREEFDWIGLAEIKQRIDDIELLDMLGGEPLLSKPLLEFLRELVDMDRAKDIDLIFDTNGTVYTPRLAELLSEFKSVNFKVSMEAVGAANDYIRYPSKFSKVCKNIDLYKQMPNSYVQFMPTFGILNIFTFPELLSWAELRGLPMAMFNYVHTHSYQDPVVLPKPLKEQLLEKIEGRTWNYMGPIEAIKSICATPSDPELFKQFKSYIELRDMQRKQNILESLPYFKPYWS